MVLDSSLEQDIISLYDSNLKSLFSINQISKKLNKRYPYINKKVTELINKEVFKKTVIGRSHLCSLNLKNERTQLLLTMHQMRKKQDFLAQHPVNIRYIVQSFDLLPHTIVAVPTENTIYIICPEKAKQKRQIQSSQEIRVINRETFSKILEQKEHPLFTDHVVLYGFERFFELLSAHDKELSHVYSPLVIQ